MERDAIFDGTKVYRYSLWRRWNSENPKITFILLNPSQADAQQDDPTLRRCIGFAKSWGYGSLEVVNLFAFRTPTPQTLRSAIDPVGPECDRYVLAAVTTARQTVIGWGNWGQLHQRDRAVLQLLAPYSPLYCLGLNRTGHPRHPLYIQKNAIPLGFY